MSALFNFQAFMTMVILFICLAAYLREQFPQYIGQGAWFQTGFGRMVKDAAVVGDRLSPWVSLACMGFAVANILYR